MSMYAKSKPLNDQELTKLLTDLLIEALGEKAKLVNIEQIVGIAKEMLRDAKPEGITKKEVKERNSEMSKALESTLVAATAVHLLMTHQKDTLHQLLDRHKLLTEKMKGLKPNSPEHEETRKEINNCKIGIKKVLRELNRLDPNPERREAFDKQLDNDIFFTELAKPQDPEMQKQMEKGDNLTAQQDKTLTESLINLFGMDPRVPGSPMSPVQCVIGNEMGIPDNYPAYTANEPLHALSDDIMTPIAVAVEGSRAAMMNPHDKHGTLESIATHFENTLDEVLQACPELGYESPTLTR